jgi:galactokinase
MIRLFVPGRLCLFGEHSDWAGGYRRSHRETAPGHCLVAGTGQGLSATVEPLEGVLEVATRLPGGEVVGPASIAMRLDALEAAARAGSFFSYAAGTAAEVMERHDVGGLRLEIRADLPIGKGLSSSAAVCVLVVRALALVHGLALGVREEMDLAYRGERRAGSECGRMDQICAYGRGVVWLRFDGDDLEVEPLQPSGDVHLVIVDLGRPKDTRRILADLHRCFPDTPGPLAAGVRRALGAENLAIVTRARRAITSGDAAGIGALMTEAQEVFDRLVAPASAELAAPRLHEVLGHPAVRELGWGGKGVGSQGDGSAQVVARDAGAMAALAGRLEHDLGVGCLPMTIPGAAG